jgi:lipid-A-disaccharide synthase
MKNSMHTKKFYFIAGEPSGDYIGSKIIAQIKKINTEALFCGVGGAKMIDAGLDKSLIAIEEISLFGLFEILPHLFRLNKLINNTVADIIKQQPNVLITIDSPGFCFRVAQRVKRHCPDLIKVHIVAPSVWAYKPERAMTMARWYDRLLTILPFEAPFFEKFGLQTNYIGHPIFEQQLENTTSQEELPSFKERHNISKDIIAITPGSRMSEIKRHLPVFIQSILLAKLDVACVIVSVSPAASLLIADIMQNYQLPYLVTTEKLPVFKEATIVLAKSGTNTLEIASCATAMIVGYRLNSLTWWWLRCFLKVRFASLINIMANYEIIPEFIQAQFTPQNVATKLESLFTDKKKRLVQIAQSTKIIKEMGFESQETPSFKAAQIISVL